MEFLEKLGDFFNSFTSFIESFLRRLFGSSNDRMVKQIGFERDKEGNVQILAGSILDEINNLEPELEKLTEAELKGTTEKLRAQLADGKTLDELLPYGFAAVREAGKRYLKMRHYDVQVVGGTILHRGMIAEMKTGEGKTLVSTLPAYLNGLAGKVHVITVNDYLAKRDMEWMGAVHLGLGMTVGAIQAHMPPQERQIAYACDITYGTNNEFGFDYLRDNMKPTKELQVQGGLNYAIIDEIDNILIDEARTPLIISGPAHDDITKYMKAHRVAIQLKRDEHFELKEKEHTCHLTDEGIRKGEELAGVDSFYTAGNMEWPHLIDNSLKALHLYKRDVNYVVEGGEVVIVDEHTGRKMHGRQWSDGLHQAVEAKEGVKIKETTQTLATITLQNYFKLYNKLSGMTGTAMTEADEFYKIYGLDVVAVPTNRPNQREDHSDLIFGSMKDKWNSVVNEIQDVHKTGRPILVGTASIENSEVIAEKLKKRGIRHSVLNAKFHEREAEIVSQAGRLNAVTISTNMAGRGTDIVLGGNPEHLAWDELQKTYESRLDVPKAVWEDTCDQIAEKEGMKAEASVVREKGGLYVIGTERHESRRIDNQLRGRAGRQGDPGTSRFFVSLEDDQMRIFGGDRMRSFMVNYGGLNNGEYLENPMISRQISNTQKKREEYNFEARKNLLEYDEVMDEQRKRVYSYRQNILDGGNCRGLIMEMIHRQLQRAISHFLSDTYRWESVAAWASQRYGIILAPSEMKGLNAEQMPEYLKRQTTRQSEDLLIEQCEECLPEGAEDERDYNWGTLSSWANTRFGLNTNDRELKKIGRDEIQVELFKRIQERIEKLDFTESNQFFDERFAQKSLSAWLNHQFLLEVDPETLAEKPPEAVEDFLFNLLDQQYHQQEVNFPVAVGMTRFVGSKNEGADKAGLIQWARQRFQSTLSADAVESSSIAELENQLKKESEAYLSKAQDLSPIDEQLNQIYANGEVLQDDSQSALQELISWGNSTFQGSLTTEEFKGLDRDAARMKLMQAYDQSYRPEFSHTERSLLLEVLDSTWKEHLYYMDHLRSGIGLVGYAQKDPKVEYKREGMKAFEQMWDRISDNVTQAIFRIEKESPDFVGRLWEISATTHNAPEEDNYIPEPQQQPPQQFQEGGVAEKPPLEPGASNTAVEPIRNTGVKVGRNDPCPCGSGKKYKKCCGENI